MIRSCTIILQSRGGSRIKGGVKSGNNIEGHILYGKGVTILALLPRRYMKLNKFLYVLTHKIDCMKESEYCKAHDRYVSSTVPTVKRPTVWWNRFCQCTYQRKLQAWSRCDWLAYRNSVIDAKQAQAVTFHLFSPNCSRELMIICGGILLRIFSGLCKTHNQSAPDVDSLASYFAGKLSLSTDLIQILFTVPPEVYNVTYKKPWRVKLSKVHSVLRSLNVKKAVGPDGVSPYTLKYCCDELCYPVYLLFHRVCRAGEFPLSWKISRITPVYKCKGSVTDP